MIANANKMSSKPIIEIKNLGKKYNITHERGGYIALRDVLMNVIKSPFSFLKVKAKRIAGMETKEEFWALRNVNLKVNEGEIIGIIGANGAGKSTLLKILTGITPPTEGEIIMRGRVASLLEVGTGFHPELTGRENIFLNGAILGMTKKEIARKFDDIVAFAGIEKFLDTPVKYYSSGMYVRLAFSVAAHMEPDVLLVDEVLAVGDAEFQKKCLGKMEEVTRKEGRTILFVSHNMGAIRNICNKCILLKNGQLEMIGETDKVVDYYLNSKHAVGAVHEFPVENKKEVEITKISILNKDLKPSTQIPISQNFFLEIEYQAGQSFNDIFLTTLFFSGEDLLMISSEADRNGEAIARQPGRYASLIKIPEFLFNVGRYNLEVAFDRPFVETIDRKTNLNFEIIDVDNPRSRLYKGHNPGKIAVTLDYDTKKI